MKKNVEISGMGVITPIGIGVDEFSEGLKKGSSNFQELELTHEGQEFKFPIGKVDEFDLKKEVMNLDLPEEILKKARRLRNLSKGAAFAVYCALDAWCKAKLTRTDSDPNSIAIVVCGSNFQQGYLFGIQEKYRNKLQHLSATYGLNFLDTDVVGIVSELLNIRGEGSVVGAASASGNMGLIQGTRLVENGDYDIVLVIAPMMELSIYEYLGFTGMRAMASLKPEVKVEDLCSPFDAKHQGFVFGENAGCIILESEDHLKKRNADSLASIKGVGVSLDANRNPNPSEEGETLAMKRAMNKAGVEASNIQYANLHGSSSSIGDVTEIKAALGAGLKGVKANSTKSLIGHGVSAAGLVEAVACVIQMNEQFVHATNNLVDPISKEIDLVMDQPKTTPIEWCITNSYGFGGINTSIILKRK